MKRRNFLAGSLAFGAAGYATKSVANLQIGGSVLTTVSDGSLQLPLGLPEGVAEDELAALVEQFGLNIGEVSDRPLNVTLWRAGERAVLFDAGSGPAFVDSAGTLYENLDAAGVSLDEITDVVFTHAHPDHLWGILDDFDEVPFPSARLWIGKKEHDFWIDPAAMDALDASRQFFAVGAQRRLEAIADTLEFIVDGDEFIPGLTAINTFGHTPGHMSFAIQDGGETAMVLGDCVTNAHLHFARPGWPTDGDQDPDVAAATRLRVLSDLASSGERVIGYHLPEGGIGRVEADGDGYRFVPDGA